MLSQGLSRQSGHVISRFIKAGQVMLSQGLLRQSGHVISRFIKAVRACYLKVY